MARTIFDNSEPMPDRIRRVLAELQIWCSESRGRQTEVAAILGVKRQRVSGWFRGKSMPRLETFIKIEAFLKKQRRRK